ncbi:MAG: 5'-methylthioadenosine/S-adenosylhomocysteine nucleosidase [Clostridia bacterium]|nr:5'-methylthioadenosine/S-adenosylhomocysteine nucleosidase [Clostridia bacterium]MBQ2326105.1 5'-methylthioadenosine/S-adenosylhomocysteine nucleosidase [Clostridia bacterium]MBQ5812730.1 5'-methylthioadenosine/S-adenosylhomocysteine nucleosidase [Clostridia bacterium]
MKKIGMLVAVEIGSVLSKYGKASEEIEKFGFKVYKYEMPQYELYVVHSGAGEIAAAAATQLLIAVYGVEAVVNFGVVGGLTEDMKLSKTVVVEKVVHYDFDVSAIDHVEVGRYTSYPEVYIPLNKGLIEMALQVEPSLKRVACASADKFVDGRENKSRIAQQFGADICEMELAAIVLTCDRSGIPCLAIKTVSDAIDGGAEEFGRTVNEAADVCLRITDKIIANM